MVLSNKACHCRCVPAEFGQRQEGFPDYWRHRRSGATLILSNLPACCSTLHDIYRYEKIAHSCLQSILALYQVASRAPPRVSLLVELQPLTAGEVSPNRSVCCS